MSRTTRKKSSQPQRKSQSDNTGADESGRDIEIVPPEVLRERIKKKLDPQLFEQLEFQMRMSMWRSDWPPSDCLEGYSETERAMIMAAVKQRTEAGIARENDIATRSQTRMDRAQIFGLIIALAAIAGAVYLGKDAKSWAESAIAIALALAGIGGPNVARLIADRYYLGQMKNRR